MELYKSVYQSVVDIILDLKDFEEDEISPAMTFEDLDLDSLDFIEMQVLVKKKYGVVMDAAVFESGDVSTIQEMCNYVVGIKEEMAEPA